MSAKLSDDNKAKKELKNQTPNASEKTTKGDESNKKNWSYGMFTPTEKTRDGRNRSFGGDQPDRDKLLIFGAISGVLLVALLAYYEMGYKEIAWKDFTIK